MVVFPKVFPQTPQDSILERNSPTVLCCTTMDNTSSPNETASAIPENRPAGTPRPAVAWVCFGCLAMVFVVALVAASVFATLWWLNQPIDPVILSPRERTVAEAKLAEVELAGEKSTPKDSSHNATVPPVRFPQIENDAPPSEADRPYVAGSRMMKLTEREVNGLLNAHTDLGQTLRVEFGRDAINAYLALRIPEDFPIAAGQMLRARGRVRVAIGEGTEPQVVLEDVTVYGLSLPKAWLGNLKGENLLEQHNLASDRRMILHGVKSLKIEPGQLLLEVTE